MYRTRSLYTKAGFQVQQNLHWEMLTDDQCEAVLVSAIELLERTGVEVLDEASQNVFSEAGCLVKESRVRISSSKIESALRSAPSRVTLCDRTGKRAIKMETNHVHFGPGYTSQSYFDQTNGEVRPFVLDDVKTFGQLCQSLPAIDFAMSGGFPTDVPVETAELWEFKALLEVTNKPIIQNVKTLAQAKAVYEMACEVAESAESVQWDPSFALHVTTSEGLMFNTEALQVVAFAAEKNIPVVLSNELVSGFTAPNESAGVMLVALANSLAALVLSQSVVEGAPFITGGFFTNNDHTHEMQPYGSPEISLLGAGYSSILRYLRLPSFGFGGASDSKTSDAQMGLESAMSTLHAGLSGTNLISGAGIIESGCAVNPALLVLVDELATITRRIMRGVEMDEDRLARGVIDAVQPGGHYLGTLHTRYYFRKEQFWPTLMNRTRFDDWIAQGSKSLGDKSLEKTQNLLSTYEKVELPSNASEKLQGIIDNYETK